MVTYEKASFPIRCAGMDVGSNAFRLVIAEFKTPTQLARSRRSGPIGGRRYLAQRPRPSGRDWLDRRELP
ncbi:MAG TPA: hypothetical protein VLT84_13355, partial [Acidobacteriota bacterium]|nr:hypothetical protein [Acidobacteriota bacterium]